MIPFKQIPSNLRVPLFYAELDASRANSAPRAQRALLIGQRTNAGTAQANIPVQSASVADAIIAGGAGSILAGMAQAYRDNDPASETWLLPLADDGAAVKATATLTLGGTATARGTISLMIAGDRLPVIVSAATTSAQAATAVAAAVNAASTLPVTATVIASTVTLTARNGGECGNTLDVRVNYGGSAAGESTPAGLTIAVTPFTGGAGNPVLTTALGNLLDTTFDFIVCSLTDATSMAAIVALLNDATGRWAWSNQVYGHAFVAYRGTPGAAAGFAAALNAQHVTCVGYADSPSPSWKWAAAFAGTAAASLRADPGLPLQTLGVSGLVAPPLASRFSLQVRNSTLLFGGVSTWTADTTGAIAIENMITTYVTNSAGAADDSYLQIETLFLLMYVLRALSDVVTTKFARTKLAVDGTRLLPGSNVVTPSTIRAVLIAAYRDLERAGMVQASDAFAAGLIVEKDAQNPNRVNVVWPGTLINQLRVFALLAQFRLS